MDRYRSILLENTETREMLGESVKWRENTSRPGEVERAGMDATEYTYGAKQTDAAIRAVASRYHDRRAATSRDNDNKLSPSLSRSRLRPHPSPLTRTHVAHVYIMRPSRGREVTRRYNVPNNTSALRSAQAKFSRGRR